MKLSEAIQLGSTMIGETHTLFYDPIEKCGCAVAAAFAGTEKDEVPQRQGERGGEWFEWMHKKWPWTQCKPTQQLKQELGIGGGTVAESISNAHFFGMSRLQIADIITRYEPQEPQEQKEQPVINLQVHEVA